VKQTLAPLPGFASVGDAPAAASDDSLHDRQSDAGAGILCIAVQTLEYGEYLIVVLRVESGAVVPDVVCNRFAWTDLAHGSDFYDLGRIVAREFDCVGQQIYQSLPCAGAAAIGRHGSFSVKLVSASYKRHNLPTDDLITTGIGLATEIAKSTLN
jgi:hypothetical protein